MKNYILPFILLALLFSCKSENDVSGNGEGVSNAPSVTVGTDHLSAISVVLKGKANLSKTIATDWVIGFQYSLSSGIMPTNSTEVEAEDADSDYNYTTSIIGLEPGTTYYYRSFIRENGQDTYGETKSFTTNEITSLLETLDATEIEPTSAKLNGSADLMDLIFAYQTIEYGFFWGSSESSLLTKLSSEIIEGNAFSATLTNLSHKTQYWYKTYMKIEDQTFYGDIMTFVTALVPVESVSLNKTEYTFHAIGHTLTLRATVLPVDATDMGVEWSSDNNDVATVDSQGEVTAMGNGKTTITVKTKDQNKIATCEVTVAQCVTSITLDKTSLLLEIGDEAMLSVTSVLPDNAIDKSYTWSSSNNAIASVDNNGNVKAKSNGNTVIRVRPNDGSSVFASCLVVVGEIDASQAVDMGTVVNGNNIKWASCNIGASSPEEYSLLFFAWGETEPKSDYSWSTYKFGTSESGPFSKYNTRSSYGPIDNKIVLDPEDDVAHVKLGGNWRMPTLEEWTALSNQCSWTWTTRNEVYGQLVTADNGNSIFLPAEGYRSDTRLYLVVNYGCYWSSSLYTDDPRSAWYCFFNSDGVYYGLGHRVLGASIRPVCE